MLTTQPTESTYQIACSLIKASLIGLLLLPSLAPAEPANPELGPVALGRRIYRENIGSNDQPVTAKAQGDVPIQGPQFACVNCHKRSGLGASEGTKTAPPITREFLFQARERTRKELYASSAGASGVRPAYTEATLRKAILGGVDANGRNLDPLMPRYVLSPQETDALVAYLKSLSHSTAPGVGETEIHFATVIAGNVPPNSVSAMQGVIGAFIDDKNSGTRLEERRANNGPWQMENMNKAYRKWVLHTWTLQGEPNTWPEQLRSEYAKQPVFALIGGIGQGTWQPVHDFCQSSEVPCIFPSIEQTPQADESFYSLYFSKGLRLETEALAKYLRETNPTTPIIQVVRPDAPSSVAAAESFGAVWSKKSGVVPLSTEKLPLDPRGHEKFWAALQKQPGKTWVLWLDSKDLGGMGKNKSAEPERIIITASLFTDGAPKFPANLAAHTEILSSLALPQQQSASLIRMRAWARNKKLVLKYPKIEADVYFAVIMANTALLHNLTYFSREYFIETIEHKLDQMPFKALYPKLTLGPNQRYASKGCYIVPLSQFNTPEAAKLAKWIVP